MYLRPRTLDEATAVLARGAALVVGGGTDIYPVHAGRPVKGDVLDVTSIEGMSGLIETESHYRLGGAMTWSRLIAASLPPAFDALKQAACEVGSKQIQNRGTIAGNLCNASPAADGIPPLLALDAAVELASSGGVRHLPLSSFITGYRKTARNPDEILTGVLVPKSAARGHAAFAKLGARRYLVISILMAAANIERAGDGRIAAARIAIGAASPVALRLAGLEADLQGLAKGQMPSLILSARHLESLAPIDDVRASAEYRRDAALTIIGDVLDRAFAAGHA